MPSSGLPHFSLRNVEQALPDLILPEDPGAPTGAASMSFVMREYSVLRTEYIDGATDLSVSPGDGVAALEVLQSVPMFWNRTVDTWAQVTCRDDQLLRPLRWTTDFACTTPHGELEETRGTSRGWVSRNTLHHDGVDETRVPLPEDQPLTTTWSLLAALPRLTASGVDRVSFTLLEDLLAVRPRQLLERIDPIDVSVGGRFRRLYGWRHRGVGFMPTHYWTTETGWPLLVCGLRRVLMATHLSATPRPIGG